MRVLIADDDVPFTKHIMTGLSREGFCVDCAHDGEEALRSASERRYDAIILDVCMPHPDGVQVLRELRQRGVETPAIFLTGRGDDREKVAGLDAGGDDYVVKPASLAEILARLRAVLRRHRSSPPSTLRVADFELDLHSRQARRGGKIIELTNREFAILELLMTHAPRPVRKSVILERVWQQPSGTDTNVLNVYIKHLRDKVEMPGRPRLLHTVRNIGFALGEDAGRTA